MTSPESEAALTYTFPLPPDELRTNRRMGGHWGPLNKVKNAYKLVCQMAIREQGIPHDTIRRCTVTLTAYLGKRQRCDPFDLGGWSKVPLDMLVKLGVLTDDQASCILLGIVRVDRDWDDTRLVIEVREVLS